MEKVFTFTAVFHRILDFKTGLDFYPGPFFMHFIKIPAQTGKSPLLRIASYYSTFAPAEISFLFTILQIFKNKQAKSYTIKIKKNNGFIYDISI